MKTLFVPEGYEKHEGWNWTLIRMLVNSKMFNIKTKEFPYTKINGTRNGNWTLMEIDGILIGLDTWDTWAPTSTYNDHKLFEKQLKDVKLILKIQYYKCEYWDSFEKLTGIKIRPWIVMPTKDFPLRSFRWKQDNHKWIGTVTGRNNRFGRQAWVDWCSNNKLFHSSGKYLVDDTLDQYINRLKECKWGIILKGKSRNHDGKNRRECEFSSCGMPLALNYKPTYTFNMEPGKHYFYLDKPEDLSRLIDTDPKPFAQASDHLYYEHFSPYGSAKTLLSILGSL